jgi:hypothetical protein
MTRRDGAAKKGIDSGDRRRFVVGEGEPITLADYLAANADDVCACEWARVAVIGDYFPDGEGCHVIDAACREDVHQ